MAWENNPQFLIDEAQQRGVDVYEVLVDDWSVNQGGDINLQWPPAGQAGVPVSIAGIAIGPRSTIDRCWVSYDLQKQKLGVDLSITDRLRRLSVDSPLIYGQAANRGITPDYSIITPVEEQVQKGPLVITAYAGIVGDPSNLGGSPYPGATTFGPVDSTVMPLEYVDVNGVTRNFIPESSPTASPGALNPLLHLLIYLKAPPPFVPTRRFPLILRGKSIPQPSTQSEFIVAQIPVYGRRQIKLMMVGHGTGPWSFRIGGLRALAAANPSFLNIYEEPVDGTTTPVADGVPVVLSACNGLNTGLDYLNIYATTAQEIGLSSFVTYQFSAYD